MKLPGVDLGLGPRERVRRDEKECWDWPRQGGAGPVPAGLDAAGVFLASH
jgi:hypothetical protein